ncbi:MAG TPA: DUF5916 domain-containing protein, partial [Rhodothermales bacterium]|nr:DUF5916 domain-containing protein [Rhodothermales bacterium]
MRPCSLLLIFLLGPARLLVAQSVPEVRAVRIAGAPPAIDGRLNESIWAEAPAATAFTQRQPSEGSGASERTEVRFAYDGDALYVGARMEARAGVRAPVSRRDVGSEADRLLVSLDTYHDRRTAYTFGVTASGVRIDHYHGADNESADTGFDPVWDAAAQADADGWTAEMRIPFSQLRFTNAPVQAWGLNVLRISVASNEEALWVPIPRSVQAWASRFGVLTGIEGVRPSRRVELRPYVAAEGQLDSTPAPPGDPFFHAREGSVRAGGDLKVGLGPSLTLDATINPDFGQVEQDPAIVNLSAFEIFFPERRPFFTEGLDLLSGGGAGYFYSRRIGAAPRGSAPGDFSERPDYTTILGAAKLTGRLDANTSVGALTALTARERARTFDADTGTFSTVEVEPMTAFGVARVQRQFGRNESTAGLVVTGLGRDLRTDALAALLPRRAFSGGADLNLRLRGGEYVVGAYAGASHVAGDSLAILRLQRSSARYYQRPDANYVDVDPSRTSLSGLAAGVSANRVSGRHWLWGTSVDLRTPGFELNDAGRLGSADEVFGVAFLRYRETKPGPVLRAYSIQLSSENQWNLGGVQNFAALRTDASLTWRNFWRTNHTAWVDLPAQSDDLSRGGPLVGTGAGWVVINQVINAASSRRRWSARLYYGQNEYQDPTYRLSGSVSVRPSTRWQLSVEPNYVRFGIGRQFIGTRAGGSAATFGQRYVFARVDLRELRLGLRASMALTPDLTLEAYAEPYAAAARHYDHGELRAARSREMRRYGTDGTIITKQANGSYTVTDG